LMARTQHSGGDHQVGDGEAKGDQQLDGHHANLES
jgi:hypothetical protein